METKPKTYKEEILPLWWEEIKQVFDLKNPINTLIKMGITVGGFWFSYWLTGNLESLLDSLSFQLGGIIFVIVGLLPISTYTYVRASNKLYDNQIELRKQLGGFIENPFDVKARPPYQKTQDEPRWASFDVINITSLVVDKCYVELISAIDSKGSRVIPITQNLKWSKAHGEANRNKEIEVYRSPRICDVAFALPKLNILIFETWAGQYSAGIGVYNITVAIHGLYSGFIKDKTFNFIMEYKGGNLINILKEGQEKWKDEELDPKPPITLIVKDALKTKKKPSEKKTNRKSTS